MVGPREERRKRRKGATRANRGDVSHAKEHMLVGGEEEKEEEEEEEEENGRGWKYVRSCTDEVHWRGQGKMGRERTRTRYRMEGAGWMDARKTRVNLFAPFGGEAAGSYRFGAVVWILTPVYRVKLFGLNSEM